MHWRRKWQLTPVFLPGESQGWRSLVGCHLWGCTESETRVSVQRSVTPPKFSGPQSKRGRTGRHRLRVHSASSRMYLLHRRFSKKRKCLPHLEVASGGSSLVRIVQREFVFLLLFLLILCLFFYFLTVLLKWIFSFFKNFY